MSFLRLFGVAALTMFISVFAPMSAPFGSLATVLAQTVTATIPVGVGPAGLAVNPKTNMVYVVNQDDGTVSVINGATNRMSDTINVGGGPVGVGVNPVTNTIYVTDYNDRTYVSGSEGKRVFVIDGATDKVTGTIAVGLDPYGAAVNPNTNRVYVTTVGTVFAHEGSGIDTVDATTNTVIRTTPVGGVPYGAGLNIKTDTVYLAGEASGLVSVINGATGTVTGTIDVGVEPGGAAVDTTTNRVYVGNLKTNLLAVIDGLTNTIITNIAVGGQSTYLRVNENTHTITWPIAGAARYPSSMARPIPFPKPLRWATGPWAWA